jgi:hypothetical protein
MITIEPHECKNVFINIITFSERRPDWRQGKEHMLDVVQNNVMIPILRQMESMRYRRSLIVSVIPQKMITIEPSDLLRHYDISFIPTLQCDKIISAVPLDIKNQIHDGIQEHNRMQVWEPRMQVWEQTGLINDSSI